MKTLIVYYSLEGNTEMIANKMREHLQADIVRLVPKKDIPSGNIKKYIWGGKSVLFGEKPELEPYEAKIKDYDIIVIGTPVWASTYAPALGTFFSENKIQGKDIYLVACHGGGGTDKCFHKLKEKLQGNQIKGKIEFVDPTKGSNMEVNERIKEFCKNILKS